MTESLTRKQWHEINTYIDNLEVGTISDYIDARTWVESRYKLTFGEYLKIIGLISDKVGIDFSEQF